MPESAVSAVQTHLTSAERRALAVENMAHNTIAARHNRSDVDMPQRPTSPGHVGYLHEHDSILHSPPTSPRGGGGGGTGSFHSPSRHLPGSHAHQPHALRHAWEVETPEPGSPRDKYLKSLKARHENDDKDKERILSQVEADRRERAAWKQEQSEHPGSRQLDY